MSTGLDTVNTGRDDQVRQVNATNVVRRQSNRCRPHPRDVRVMTKSLCESTNLIGKRQGLSKVGECVALADRNIFIVAPPGNASRCWATCTVDIGLSSIQVMRMAGLRIHWTSCSLLYNRPSGIPSGFYSHRKYCSPMGLTTIDADGLPGNIVTRWTGQINHCPGNILHRSQAAQRTRWTSVSIESRMA